MNNFSERRKTYKAKPATSTTTTTTTATTIEEAYHTYAQSIRLLSINFVLFLPFFFLLFFWGARGHVFPRRQSA